MWALPCSPPGLGRWVHTGVSLRVSREVLGRRGAGQPLWVRGRTACPLGPRALHPPPCPKEALACGWGVGPTFPVFLHGEHDAGLSGSAGRPVTLGVAAGCTVPLPLKFVPKKKPKWH